MILKVFLHLFPPYKNGWTPVTHICSSIENKGIDKIWGTIEKHWSKNLESGWIKENRSNQNIFWMHQKIQEQLKSEFYDAPKVREQILTIEKQVKSGEIDPFTAANMMLKDE